MIPHLLFTFLARSLFVSAELHLLHRQILSAFIGVFIAWLSDGFGMGRSFHILADLIGAWHGVDLISGGDPLPFNV